jgi:hypothetical protein
MVADEKMNSAGLAMPDIRERRLRERRGCGSGASCRRVSMARMAMNMVRSIVRPTSGTAVEARSGCVSMPIGRAGMSAGILLFLEIRSLSDGAGGGVELTCCVVV